MKAESQSERESQAGFQTMNHQKTVQSLETISVTQQSGRRHHNLSARSDHRWEVRALDSLKPDGKQTHTQILVLYVAQMFIFPVIIC